MSEIVNVPCKPVLRFLSPCQSRYLADIVHEACLSLQAAAQRFVAEDSHGKHLRQCQHVRLRASCEISPDCQSVLKHTYGICNFANILDVNFRSGRGNWCTTHQRYCKLKRSSDTKRSSIKLTICP